MAFSGDSDPAHGRPEARNLLIFWSHTEELMRHNMPTTTMAAALALALALLVVVLLPADNLVHAATPTFVPGTDAPTIPENTPPGVNIGDPISATDDDDTGEDAIEFGNTLTYSLGGADAASFDIDASTGQLITKAALDFENPHSLGGTPGDNSYVVTVTVDDGETRETPVTLPVTIRVTNVEEAPGALAPPTVVSTDTDAGTDYELKVIWYPPDDGGDGGVTGYNVEYKKTTAASFTDNSHTGTDTTDTIDSLDVDTSYQVRVQATNSVGSGPWSLSSVGSTNKEDNALPEFREAVVARNVLENAESGLVVGAPVSATDDDNVLPLAYQLHGPDANSFDLQASTGQIRTKRGVVYDSETKSTLNVTVTVSDGQGGTDARAVTITVLNVPEAPSAPARPRVRATANNSRSLEVSWTEPDNMGPAITGYDVRYRKSGSNDQFRTVTPSPTTTKATIAPVDDGTTTAIDERLAPGISYEVYVRANNGEIPSQWSVPGTGRTSAGNDEPTFDDRPNLNRGDDGELVDASTDRTVPENTRAGQSVGRAVRAVDGNGDKRTYRLAPVTGSEADVGKFDINTSTGQILTKDPLNHEASDCEYVDTDDPTTCTYRVMVRVWDGRDEHRNEEDTSVLDDTDPANDGDIIDDTITVNIMVSDVNEKPVAPTVTVTSPDTDSNTTLVVTWDVPDNTGPAITGYSLECTGHEVPDDQCPRDFTDPSAVVTGAVGTHTITGLTAAKSYRVRVRADNAEGQGAWSSWVTQSTNKEDNIVPSPTSITQLYVAENAPSDREPVRDAATGGAVVTVSGTPGDSDTLTYRLEGPGAGRFNIDTHGQIRTNSKLNHEDPECGYDSATEGTTTSCFYTMRVKVSDRNGGSAFSTLRIDVTDADEPPAKPPVPRVTATSGSGWSLEVTWNAPRNTGPAITGYQIRYRKTGDSAAVWQPWPHTETSRSAKITTILSDPDDTATAVHLEPRTQYEVQVRALNGEGDSTPDAATNWSTSGRGTTGASNQRPVFDSALPAVVKLEVEENTRSGQNVGSAIEATDPDKNRLTYTLEGPGKDSFTITSTGQIRTRAALNHEERELYALTVKVNDGQRKNNSVAAKPVTIEVTDRPEAPSTPGAPRVAGIPGSTDSVRVTWDEPATQGPAITHYSVQYAVSGSSDAFRRVTVPTSSVDRSAVITGLVAGTRYDVQVRAESDERHSDWSRSGTGSPNPDVANTKPTFSPRSHTFSVAENTPPGTDVGGLVAALDPDGDTLTYSLEGVDVDSFDIIVTNSAGQIQTKAALNFEEKASYSVAVRARDGRGGTDAVNVTINVTDVDNEAPDTPFAPTVTALSSTSIQVSWDAPENTGPPITDYDYRYRARADTNWTEVTNTTITATTATIDGLTASTSYDVEVRAKNAEGTSDWSNPGNGATNAPGANNPPVFTEGASATRAVSATSPSGTLIGDPVAATDADSGDTVTYRLEGRDAPSFDINETSGQLRTKSGITLLVGTIYTVTVVADDTKDTTRITVSIEATAAPPNNVPVFADGASTTRSVPDNATAGRNVGTPVSATDADTGDTITYSLEGTDAASFSIVPASGQIQTRAALDASVRSTYSVTVVATDSKGGRATIAVTITVTAAPASYGCATNGAVSDASNTGLVSDCEALLRARNQLEGSARLNWSEFSPIANWQGVFFGGTPTRVTVVALPRQNLNGTVPADLGDLSMLTQLNLHSNDLSGSIPPELANLSRLQRLFLHNNRLSGTIPNLSGLRNLERLWLSGSNMNLSGSVPAWLNSMSRLEQLSLWGNNLGGSIPRLTGMTSLSLLKLQSNNLTGGVPAWFGDMNGPWILYLHDNNLSGPIPANLGRNTGVGRLWLDRNDLTGTIPRELGNMSNLRTLNLHGNQLTGTIPPEIGNLSRLQHIGFHNNRRVNDSGIVLSSGLTGSIPSELGNLSGLTRLALSNNSLTGTIPSQLGNLGSLSLLWLSQNQLSGAIPSQLGALGDTLTNIKLADNSFDANTCVPRALANVDKNDYSAAGLSICP